MGAWAGTALAERADRNQPIVIQAERDGSLGADAQRKIIVLEGNASINQGTLQIRAERLEIREVAGGTRTALALGTSERQAGFRQRREGANQFVEAQSDRIEYDEAGETVRLMGRAQLRLLRGTTVTDEVQGALIVWEGRSEQFTVKGAPRTGGKGSAPEESIRMVLNPAPPASAGGPAATPTPPNPHGERR